MTTPTTQQPKRRTLQLTGLQIMFAAILAIGLSAAITFTSRITAGQPIIDAYQTVQQEITDLRREQAALLAQRDYVRSDSYVEYWARSEGKMVRPGQVLVIPVADAASTSAAQPASALIAPIETAPPAPESWQMWWALFFDTPPPTRP